MFAKFSSTLTLCINHTACRRRHGSWLASEYVKLSSSVKTALNNDRPVVALESAIITQGMPRPTNYKTAREVEEIVKENGATPATIAVIDGHVHVGLTDDQLNNLAFNELAVKLSQLDLAIAVNKRLTGGTTVAATMEIALRCGIHIFVTGGIGGVHRGAESSFDISADLTQLSSTPVNVVCSGVKSILDIPKTLEYLETQGVPVITFGPSTHFPAFFTPSSGCHTKYNFANPSEAAGFVLANQRLGLCNGSVIAVPIPDEHAAYGKIVEKAIQQSLKEADMLNIMGSKVTPFILSKVNEITDGASLKANIGLIHNNAKIGSQIAVAYHDLKNPRKNGCQKGKRISPLVIGASAVDFVSKTKTNLVFGGPSNAVDVTINPGGVGRNIAEGIYRMGGAARFLSVVGDDGNSMFLRQSMPEMDLLFENVPNHSTGIYQLICSNTGDVEIGFQDMKINEQFAAEIIDKYADEIESSSIICLDGNLPKDTTKKVCQLCKKFGKPLLFDPADANKCSRLVDVLEGVTYFMPNINELETMACAKTNSKQTANIDMTKNELGTDDLFRLTDIAAIFDDNVEHTLLSLGKFGLLWISKDGDEKILQYYSLGDIPKYEYLTEPVKNVSGSGDTFASAFVCAINSSYDMNTAIKYGLIAAQHTVRSHNTISNQLSTSMFHKFDVQSWNGTRIKYNLLTKRRHY